VARAIALGAEEEAVREVPFGVDADLFSGQSGPGDLREDLRLGSRSRVVFSPRGTGKRYGAPELVRAFSIILDGHPDAVLFFRDSSGSAEDTKRVRELAEGLEVEDRVRFAPAVDHQAMPTSYAVADVVVSLASPDSSPVSILEAMACGRVVVAGDVPGVREWIRNGENGFLVDPENPASIAAGIEAGIGLDEATRNSWAASNRRDIQERASFSENMNSILALYQRLCSGTRTASG
jgi:glycosyltransferase involved in cell wall biosynthesis